MDAMGLPPALVIPSYSSRSIGDVDKGKMMLDSEVVASIINNASGETGLGRDRQNVEGNCGGRSGFEANRSAQDLRSSGLRRHGQEGNSQVLQHPLLRA